MIATFEGLGLKGSR